MEIRQLTTFRTVATTLSFTRAAEALSYAQSSVTAQIQALEEELGVPLFERLGRRVVLTAAGLRALSYAEQILGLADEARLAILGEDEIAGVLTIGAPESLCTYRLPPVLHQFHEHFPNVQLVFRPGMCGELRQVVCEGLADVAFVLEPAVDIPGLITELLVPEPLLVLAPPSHPLAGRSAVAPADLHNVAAVLTEKGCSYRALFERALNAAGARPCTTMEMGSIEAIKQCVMSGMGLTVLPEVAVATEVSDGRLVALRWTGPPLQMVTQMVRHKDKWMSPALSAFMELARETLGAASVCVPAASTSSVMP